MGYKSQKSQASDFSISLTIIHVSGASRPKIRKLCNRTPPRAEILQSTPPPLRGSETPLYLVLGRQKGLGRGLMHPWFIRIETKITSPCQKCAWETLPLEKKSAPQKKKLICFWAIQTADLWQLSTKIFLRNTLSLEDSQKLSKYGHFVAISITFLFGNVSAGPISVVCDSLLKICL